MEQIIGTFDSAIHAHECREALLEIYAKERPWYYVYNFGDLTVANEFGGQLDDALIVEMKQFIVNWVASNKKGWV